MLTKGKIASFTGGISQQAPSLRLPTQSTDEVNTYLQIVDGSRKRPPSEHIGFGSQVSASAFSHFIVRDASEKYILSISGGSLAVTDLLGNSRAVSFPNGAAYLANNGIADNLAFRAVSVADYTFVSNRTVSTALSSSSTAPGRNPEALVNIAQGNYGKTYTVFVNGTQRATYTTPQGATYRESTFIDTEFIASVLVAALTGTSPPAGTYDPTFVPNQTKTVFTDPSSSSSVGNQYGTGDIGTYSGTGDLTTANGWTVARYANAIHIASLTGVDFSISVQDGYNGNAMKVVKGQTQFFTDLPSFGPDGFVAAIIGDQGNNAQVYYVRLTKGNTSDSVCTWQECPKPGIVLGPDPSTMPHILVRNADGTFTFEEAVWNPRQAGDDVTNPHSSFYGEPIDNIVLYQARLGFLSTDNIVFSRASDFFNFWRTTATEIIDDDPIDINAATSQVSLFRGAAPYQSSLIMFSDLTQFSFSGNELLTPKTANLNVVTSYSSLVNEALPVATPRRIYFPISRGDYVGIREWYYDIFYRTGEADDDTAHVPALIPSGVFKLANSTTEDCLFVATTGAPDSLYVYKYAWQGRTDKLQSAWSRWQFPGAVVLNFEVIDSSLYLVLDRGSQTSIELIRLGPGLTDSGSPLTYLDRRLDGDTLGTADGTNTPAPPVYDITSNTTTYALPYSPQDTSTLAAVTKGGQSVPQYVAPQIVSVSGRAVRLAGDTRGLHLWFGHTYTQSIRLSPIYMRDDDKGAIEEGRLQLLKLDLMYRQTGYFRVQVTPIGRGVSIHEFNPWESGGYQSTTSAVQDGTFTFPVMSRADNVDIDIINDGFLPATFIRAEWKANFVPKARK